MTLRQASLFIMLLLALLTGCGGGTATSGNAGRQPIALIGRDIAYDKTDLQGTVGQPISVHFTNEGALEHDFTIDEIPLEEGEHDAHAEEHESDADVHLHTEAGEEGELSFTPAQAGTYTYYCTVPGHREAGMEGTLTVTNATN